MKQTSKTLRKLLSLTLCLIMVLGSGAVGLTAAYAETTMAGDGSASDPYQITNYDQLQEFSSIVNGGDTDACAVLINDILVESDSTGFTPIGLDDDGYSGTFDGQNHKIDGISLSSTYHSGLGENFVGLFSSIGKDGVLRDLVLSNVKINDVPRLCGIFVLDNEGGVKNCVLSGNITFGRFAYSSTTFAAIANGNYGKISGCINKCDIDAGISLISGIARKNGGIISDCCNFGNLSGDTAYGICMNNFDTISRCVNFGNINAEEAAGLIGKLSEGSVSECYNTGKITGGYSAKALISSYGSATFNKIYYNSETSGCTDSYATGKTTAELKGYGVVKALGFSEEEWTERDNDYPLPTSVFNMLYTELTSDMVMDIPDCLYTDHSLTPDVTIIDCNKTLTKNKDYTVAYFGNLFVGTAIVKIHGIGDYYGEVTTTFKITPRTVILTSASASKAYDGASLTNNNVIVSGDGFANGQGVEWKCTGSQTDVGASENEFTYNFKQGTEPGDYIIKVRKGTLTVTPKALNASMISGVYNASYTGKPIEWNIVVKDGDKTLAEITDYTVSYKDNTNAGTASVTITGIGNYGGTVTEKFIISPAAQNAPTGITSTDETKCSASDGTISGLTTAMEISSDGRSYAPCTGTTMTGLAHGTYYIRYAGSTNYAASDSTQVEIKNGDCYGGTATCVSKAVCDGCHNEYGELGTHCYEWKSDDTHYWQKCKYCNEETQKKDLPSVTLNCPERICKDQIPEITFTVPEGWSFFTIGLTTNFMGDNFYQITHLSGNTYAIEFSDSELSFIKFMIESSIKNDKTKLYCRVYLVSEDGFEYKAADNEISIQTEHSGGTATCVSKAVCDVCGKEYGEFDNNNHAFNKVEFTWSKSYDVCTAKFTCQNDAKHTKEVKCDVKKEITTEPTCTTQGEYTCTATVNFEGKTYSDVQKYSIPVKEHEWNDFYTVDKEPTVTEPGCKSIHCKHCDATKDSQPVLSLTNSFEEYKQATIEKLDSLITEHNSIISKIVVSFADFVIKRCDYDDTKSYEENIASVDEIAQDAINMINARHDFNYGCPFIRCIANIFDPCFVTARCIVHFVLIQILKVL